MVKDSSPRKKSKSLIAQDLRFRAMHEGSSPHFDLHPHSHSHSDSHDHGHSDSAHAGLRKALIVTLIFMVVETVGGFWANSLALLSDAAHMATDAGSIALSLFVFWFARRPTTSRLSYGYHRVEILGALVSGILIWILSGFLIYEAIERMQSPEEVQGQVVAGIALIGLIANLISIRFLHAGHSHANLNIKAAYLHIVGDLLGSVGALIAGLILWQTGWKPIDPLITLLVSALMVVSSWTLIRDSIHVLLESTPLRIDPHQVEVALKSLPEVIAVHDLHIWSVSSEKVSLSVHLVSPTSQPDQLLKSANTLLKTKFEISHTTIQIERSPELLSENCHSCDSPHTQE